MLTWVPCTTVCNRYKPDILHTCSQHGHTPIDFYAKHSKELNLWAKVFLFLWLFYKFEALNIQRRERCLANLSFPVPGTWSVKAIYYGNSIVLGKTRTWHRHSAAKRFSHISKCTDRSLITESMTTFPGAEGRYKNLQLLSQLRNFES